MKHNLSLFYKNRPVLVTGGAGFIGSQLVDALVELGAHVTVLDNFSTGTRENLGSVQNRIKLIHGDITNFETCLDATRKAEVIFHLAALVSVPESCKNPHACHTINVTGTHNLLEAARQQTKTTPKKLIFSSSAAVYGAHEGICSETTPSIPCSPYGFSKLMGELYCQQYTSMYGVETTVLRYFNVYGPRQKANTGVVAHFKHCLAMGTPLTIHGDGLQERDFVPVQTVVTANLLFGARQQHALGNTFNIATGTSISLIALVNRLKAQYPDYPHPITFAPARPGDIRYSAADCSKFKAFLANQGNDQTAPFYGILDLTKQDQSITPTF